MGTIAARAHESRGGPFWLGHIRLGLTVSTAVILVVAAHLALAPDRPSRSALWVIVGMGGALTLGLSLLPWRRLVMKPLVLPLLVSWTLSLVVLVVVFAVLDGERSPFAVLIVLPLVFASMAYPPAPTVLVGIWAVLGHVVIAVTDPVWDTSRFLIGLTVLISIATMAGITARNHDRSLQRAEQLAAQLDGLAHLDHLTGCLNRRGFQSRLDAEMARASRTRSDISLLQADLDHFKRINDRHGHPVGDRILADVGAALHRVARRSDIVGRIGGEEFSLVLPDTPAAEAEQIAERVRSEIAGLGGPVAVTISIGVSSFPELVSTQEDLIGSADRALYEAKRLGRDRVVTTGVDRQLARLHSDPP